MARRYAIAAAAAAVLGLATFSTGGRVGAAEVELYDFVGFEGRSLVLTQSAPDLDAHDFDNDVEAIRVISGTWSFHRDDGFQNINGPPLVLGPGDYPDIELLGFPGDRMSSVQLVQDTTPPPDCQPPYLTVGTGGRCVFVCAQGTVPDPASGECQCASGLVETGADDAGRRICGPATLQPPAQPPAQLQLPDLQRIPVPPPAAQPQPAAQAVQRVPIGEAMVFAGGLGFSFQATRAGDNAATSCSIERDGGSMLLVAHYTAGFQFGLMTPTQACFYRLFDGRALAAGWRFAGRFDPEPVGDCAMTHSSANVELEFVLDASGSPVPRPGQTPAFSIFFDPNFNLCDRFVWRLRTIGLEGPENADWRQAFQ